MKTKLNKLGNRAKWIYRKNWPDIGGVFLRNYPNFITANKGKLEKNAFPVFVFHRVKPDLFEEQLQYLHENRYVTLSADEFLVYLTGDRKGTGREILLTFDDGSISLWSVAYPLLEKYGMKAVAFILPGLIHEGEGKRPNLKQVWNGETEFWQLPLEETESNSLCTWKEIEEMHRSGVVDFQSHTLYHALIPVSNKVVDFFHPQFDRHYFGNIFVPLYRKDGADLVEREVPLGTPIYSAEPRMAKFRRFFDDENIRLKCQDFVLKEGGERFFGGNWRKRMEAFYQSVRRSKSPSETFETKEEQEENIYAELLKSKNAIERRLNKSVEHLCYPWFIGSRIAIKQSIRAGYKTNFWGYIPGVRENVTGSDRFRIVRLEDRFIFRLPGDGRKPLPQIMGEKIKAYGKSPLKNMRLK